MIVSGISNSNLYIIFNLITSTPFERYDLILQILVKSKWSSITEQPFFQGLFSNKSSCFALQNYLNFTPATHSVVNSSRYSEEN